MKAKELREFCEMDAATKDLLKTAISQFGLSGRGYDRILKVSRTIADLEGGGEHRNAPCRRSDQLSGVRPQVVWLKRESEKSERESLLSSLGANVAESN